jgi:hypothetical protein
VVASEAARAEVRSAARRALESAGREAVEEATADATKAVARRGAAEGLEDSARLTRWWTVRAAGGTYQVFRRLPEALPKMTVPEIADLGRALASKAGLTLSTWGPLRFLKDGREVLRRIPPEKGLKYLGVQATQAAVGVVGFHKMEEHLASRRASSPAPKPGG